MAQDDVISRRAGCAERCTSGSEGGPGKRAGGNTDTAPRSDPYTYLKSWEGVGFFSFVLDVYSRRCVGWQLSSNMRTDLVLDALRMALGTRRHGADLQLIITATGDRHVLLVHVEPRRQRTRHPERVGPVEHLAYL